MPLTGTEKFTLPCFSADSCGDCVLAKFVKERGLDESGQRTLEDMATVAGSYLTEGNRTQRSRGEVVGILDGSSLPGGPGLARAAVDGFMQWRENCIELIEEGEY